MSDYAAILQRAYQNFILDVEGKRVAIPYRRNDPPVEHPARQGKSSPEVISAQLLVDSKEQNFDLVQSSVTQIRGFMQKNLLGLDCSGFAYRLLDELVKEVMGRSFTENGLTHVGRTNVARLTSAEFSKQIPLNETRSGDIIKLNSRGDILHCMVVLRREDLKITYAHSSGETKMNGVHQGKARINLSENLIEFAEELGDISYNPNQGDSMFRLNLLT